MNQEHGDHASSDYYILLYKGTLNIVIKLCGDRTRAEFNTLPLLYNQFNFFLQFQGFKIC